MRYERFEDVPVWQKGIELSVGIFEVTEDPAFRHRGDVADQIQRAGLSVPNNIAEGFERGTTAELIQFLYYAKGSAGEVRSICHVADRLPALRHLKSQIADLRAAAESVSRQIAAWARSLQNSEIKGPRHLTERSKAAYEQKQRADAFMDRLRREAEERTENLRRARGTAATDGQAEP